MEHNIMGNLSGNARIGTAMMAKAPPCVDGRYPVVGQLDVASAFPREIDGGELSCWSPVLKKASLTCVTMAILNIPYTYPKSRLIHDIDVMGLPYSDFHYPADRKSKNRSRGFAFVKFTTFEAADTFQKLFHNRVLSDPGSPARNVSVLPSESSTTGQKLLGDCADSCSTTASWEPERWPLQRTAAPPGLHHRWRTSENQGKGSAGLSDSSNMEHLGDDADSCSALSEPERWPLQCVAAPPGLHHRWHAAENQDKGSVGLSVSYAASGQQRLGSHADECGVGSESERWPAQRLAAPPGLHHAWYASKNQSNCVVGRSGSYTSSQQRLASHADDCGAGSELERWSMQRLAAPPGVHHRCHAPNNQSNGIVDRLASSVPLSIFEDGTVVLQRFSV